jgi:hypothetical protein
VNENGETPSAETLLCGRCSLACDPEDNFCRHCGLSLREQQLPSVREGPHLPAVREISVPSVVAKGAAVVAAGTLAEAILRRVLGGVLRRRASVTRAPAKQTKGEVVPQEDVAPEETHILSETLFVRHLRIRR